MIKERLVNAYLDSSNTCTYLKTTAIPDRSESSDFDCLLGKSDAYARHESDIQAFVLDRVARDFPGHKFALRWDLEDEIDPLLEAYPMRWPQGFDGVWICSNPVLHPLTTTTYTLALCSVENKWGASGFQGSVKIYEVRPSIFGMLGRRIYEKNANPEAGFSTGAVLEVSFGFFNAHVSAIEKEHHLKGDAKVKVQARVMAYRNGVFEPFFEFDSFAFAGPPRDCETSPHAGCKANARAFQFLTNPLTNGDLITVFEGEAPGIFEDWDYAKEIPFVFDAKNWTLKRKFPLKPGDTF